MVKNIIFPLCAFLGIFLFSSCENKESDFGVDLLNDNVVNGTNINLGLVSYNLYDNDTIRADQKNLGNALLGIYDEPIFGSSKAEYATQVRLGSLNPDFGIEPELDSVVLSIIPSFSSTDKVTTEKTLVNSTDLSVKRIKTTVSSPLTDYYGLKKQTMTLVANYVSNDLGSIDDGYRYSNAKVSLGEELGSLSVVDSVRLVTIKDGNGAVISQSPASYQIKLSKDFFKQKIISKQGQVELNDNARFINYFKGIQLSVKESNGFIFRFSPSTATLIMYYRSKNSSSDTSKISRSYSFSLSDSYNVRNGIYTHNHPQSILSSLKNPDTTNGDEKLYLQGMGGSKAIININQVEIDNLKSLRKTHNISIVNAKLRFYLTDESMNFQKPNSIFANLVDFNSDGKTIKKLHLFEDHSKLSSLTGWQFSPNYDQTSNPGYYDINMTEHLRRVVEFDSINRPIVVELGSFTGSLLSPYNNSKAYQAGRIIFHGNKSNDVNKKLKLDVIYSR